MLRSVRSEDNYQVLRTPDQRNRNSSRPRQIDLISDMVLDRSLTQLDKTRDIREMHTPTLTELRHFQGTVNQLGQIHPSPNRILYPTTACAHCRSG